MKLLLIAALRVWKLAISPWMGSNCRFYPSCSEYAMGSIERYGVIKGVWLSTKRVLRCNSLSAGGFDPVAAEGSLEAMGTDPSEDALRTEISRNSQGKR